MIRAYGCSDIGQVRSQNQDSFYIPGDHGLANLIAVADGMGGPGGSLASVMALEGIMNELEAECVETVAGRKVIPCRQDIVERAIWHANQAIYQKSQQDVKLSGMGTTLTMALFDIPKMEMLIAHIGDSRAYRLHNQSLTQLTSDHSLVAELLASGEITDQQAIMHPQRNIITRVLGTYPLVEADYYRVSYQKDDVFLLCSDGLSGLIPLESIQAVLNQEDIDFAHKPCCLVQLANKQGGYDNITAVLAMLYETGGAQ